MSQVVEIMWYHRGHFSDCRGQPGSFRLSTPQSFRAAGWLVLTRSVRPRLSPEAQAYIDCLLRGAFAPNFCQVPLQVREGSDRNRSTVLPSHNVETSLGKGPIPELCWIVDPNALPRCPLRDHDAPRKSNTPVVCPGGYRHEPRRDIPPSVCAHMAAGTRRITSHQVQTSRGPADI